MKKILVLIYLLLWLELRASLILVDVTTSTVRNSDGTIQQVATVTVLCDDQTAVQGVDSAIVPVTVNGQVYQFAINCPAPQTRYNSIVPGYIPEWVRGFTAVSAVQYQPFSANYVSLPVRSIDLLNVTVTPGLRRLLSSEHFSSNRHLLQVTNATEQAALADDDNSYTDTPNAVVYQQAQLDALSPDALNALLLQGADFNVTIDWCQRHFASGQVEVDTAEIDQALQVLGVIFSAVGLFTGGKEVRLDKQVRCLSLISRFQNDQQRQFLNNLQSSNALPTLIAQGQSAVNFQSSFVQWENTSVQEWAVQQQFQTTQVNAWVNTFNTTLTQLVGYQNDTTNIVASITQDLFTQYGDIFSDEHTILGLLSDSDNNLNSGQQAVIQYHLTQIQSMLNLTSQQLLEAKGQLWTTNDQLRLATSQFDQIRTKEVDRQNLIKALAAVKQTAAINNFTPFLDPRTADLGLDPNYRVPFPRVDIPGVNQYSKDFILQWSIVSQILAGEISNTLSGTYLYMDTFTLHTDYYQIMNFYRPTFDIYDLIKFYTGRNCTIPTDGHPLPTNPPGCNQWVTRTTTRCAFNQNFGRTLFSSSVLNLLTWPDVTNIGLLKDLHGPFCSTGLIDTTWTDPTSQAAPYGPLDNSTFWSKTLAPGDTYRENCFSTTPCQYKDSTQLSIVLERICSKTIITNSQILMSGTDANQGRTRVRWVTQLWSPPSTSIQTYVCSGNYLTMQRQSLNVSERTLCDSSFQFMIDAITILKYNYTLWLDQTYGTLDLGLQTTILPFSIADDNIHVQSQTTGSFVATRGDMIIVHQLSYVGPVELPLNAVSLIQGETLVTIPGVQDEIFDDYEFLLPTNTLVAGYFSCIIPNSEPCLASFSNGSTIAVNYLYDHGDILTLNADNDNTPTYMLTRDSTIFHPNSNPKPQTDFTQWTADFPGKLFQAENAAHSLNQYLTILRPDTEVDPNANPEGVSCINLNGDLSDHANNGPLCNLLNYKIMRAEQTGINPDAAPTILFETKNDWNRRLTFSFPLGPSAIPITLNCPPSDTNNQTIQWSPLLANLSAVTLGATATQGPRQATISIRNLQPYQVDLKLKIIITNTSCVVGTTIIPITLQPDQIQTQTLPNCVNQTLQLLDGDTLIETPCGFFYSGLVDYVPNPNGSNFTITVAPLPQDLPVIVESLNTVDAVYQTVGAQTVQQALLLYAQQTQNNILLQTQYTNSSISSTEQLDFLQQAAQNKLLFQAQMAKLRQQLALTVGSLTPSLQNLANSTNLLKSETNQLSVPLGALTASIQVYNNASANLINIVDQGLATIPARLNNMTAIQGQEEAVLVQIELLNKTFAQLTTKYVKDYLHPSFWYSESTTFASLLDINSVGIENLLLYILDSILNLLENPCGLADDLSFVPIIGPFILWLCTYFELIIAIILYVVLLVVTFAIIKKIMECANCVKGALPIKKKKMSIL